MNESLFGVRRRVATLVAVVVAAAGLVSVPFGASAADPIVRPHLDPFYTYTGTTPIAQQPAGKVLAQRTVDTQVLAQAAAIPISSTQLLYRTVDEQGNPSVTVTTVIAPLGAITGVITYLSFYDALGDLCSPSYTLRGGTGGSANDAQAQKEADIIATLVAQGYAVQVPDFEGKDMHWVAGHESGWSTLDSIRATEEFLQLPASTSVGLIGYSGGSIGGEWASELAPTYAPELNITATAVGGIPVFLAHNLNYVNGSATWSGVIPAATVALARAYHLDLSPYLSDYGKRITAEVADKCIGEFNADYPGLKVEQLLKPGIDFLKIPAVTRIVNSLIMGTSTPGRPQMPMYMEVGNKDGTGDNVMIVKDVAALAQQYCDEGGSVQYVEASQADHTNAGIAFFASAEPWLRSAMNGNLTGAAACTGIPEGNSLAPLPVGPEILPPSDAKPVTAKLRSSTQGDYDILRLKVAAPAGTKVWFYRVRGTKRRLVAVGKVNASGAVVRRVLDRRRKQRGRYVAVVAASSTTAKATSNTVRQR